MDKLSKLPHRAVIVLGVTIAFLVVSFFPWFTLDVGVAREVNVSMWSGVGIVAGLLAIGLVVWQIRLLFELEIGRAMVIAALAVVTVIFTSARFTEQSKEVASMDAVADPVNRTFWAWLGLVLAILVAVGTCINVRALVRRPVEPEEARADGIQTGSPPLEEPPG